MRVRRRLVVIGLSVGLLSGLGCIRTAPPGGNSGSTGGTPTNAGEQKSPNGDASMELSGQISIEGSSTVFPISQAMSREFENKHPNVRVPVAGNGSGTGFKKFLLREVEICDASRSIKENEIEMCREKGIEYLELQVAIDGLTVVVNKENDWVDTMTVAELKTIWDQGSEVTKWSDVRPEWPDRKIDLFGPGTNSGTFEYFNEVINGDAKRSRSTGVSPSENDNILVTGVSNDKYAMGYFGFAYYVTAADKLKAVKVATEEGAEGVAPTPQTVEDGNYKPLSRPLFIYVNREALRRPDVRAFVTYYLSDEGQTLVENQKYVRISQTVLKEMRQRLADALASK